MIETKFIIYKCLQMRADTPSTGALRRMAALPPPLCAREIGNLLPNNQRQRRTCYALCHILYPVSAAHTSYLRHSFDFISEDFVLLGGLISFLFIRRPNRFRFIRRHNHRFIRRPNRFRFIRRPNHIHYASPILLRTPLLCAIPSISVP